MQNTQYKMLEQAYKNMKIVFEDFAIKSNLSESDKQKFYVLLDKAYINSKLNIFLNSKLSGMGYAIEKVLSHALMQPIDARKEKNTSLVYVHHISSKALSYESR